MKCGDADVERERERNKEDRAENKEPKSQELRPRAKGNVTMGALLLASTFFMQLLFFLCSFIHSLPHSPT